MDSPTGMFVEDQHRHKVTWVRRQLHGPVARGRPRFERGQAIVEFAVALPLLLTILVGVLMFGVAFNQELELTFATNAAVQQLAISRGQTTDPCATTSQAAYAAAPFLSQSNLTFTIVLDGHSVTTNSAQPTCSGSQQYLVQNQNAQITTSYPCNLKILGFNPAPNCALTAETTALIQ